MSSSADLWPLSGGCQVKAMVMTPFKLARPLREEYPT